MLLTMPSTVMVLNITNYPHVGPGGLNATGARGPATLVWAFAATTDTAIQSDLYRARIQHSSETDESLLRMISKHRALIPSINLDV